MEMQKLFDFIFAMFIVTLSCIFIKYLLRAIACIRIFSALGRPGWAGFVPCFNAYVLFAETFGSGWYFLLGLIPAVGIAFTLISSFRLGRLFGKGTGFCIGLMLLLDVFFLILALGKSQPVAQNRYKRTVTGQKQ